MSPFDRSEMNSVIAI